MMRSSLCLALLILILVNVQAGKTLDCRIFPFHPVCRGFNVGKRLNSNTKSNVVVHRKYTFAPKCRGTTAKRGLPIPQPTMPGVAMERPKRSPDDLPHAFSAFYKRNDFHTDLDNEYKRNHVALPETFSGFYQEKRAYLSPVEEMRQKRFFEHLFGREQREPDDAGVLNTFSSFYLPDAKERARGKRDDDLATFSSFYVPEKGVIV